MAELAIAGAIDLASAVILVVDDNDANVLLLERVLRRAGVGRVVAITDPRQVVARYLELDPDLIMLDLHMPQLDGIAVLSALREVIPPDSFTPVLVLTADATLDAKQQALAAGAKDFVTKPFEQSEVLLRVKNLLETRALHRTLARHNTVLAEELAKSVENERRIQQQHEDRCRRIQQVLDEEAVTMVFQPIVDLSTHDVVGVEALSRFFNPPQRRPDEWFAEAAAAGLGTELELLAVRAAIRAITDIRYQSYLSVNVSPRTALDPRLREILAPHAARTVLELTEHAPVDEYDALVAALTDLRRDGVRIAVDDAGSGYASLQHILRLAPDVIKVDIELIRGVDTDLARQSLVSAMVIFADRIGATITAEGIETADELERLCRLGVPYGQGYYLGRPAQLPDEGDRDDTAPSNTLRVSTG